jgi:hypothetical protein
MSQSNHTYTRGCKLAPAAPSADSKDYDNDVPVPRAQFFYSSALPIDDPLSPVTIPTGSDSKGSKLPPRPFSAYDNGALEEAWISFSEGSKGKDKKNHKKNRAVSPVPLEAQRNISDTSPAAEPEAQRGGPQPAPESNGPNTPQIDQFPCCPAPKPSENTESPVTESHGEQPAKVYESQPGDKGFSQVLGVTKEPLKPTDNESECEDLASNGRRPSCCEEFESPSKTVSVTEANDENQDHTLATKEKKAKKEPYKKTLLDAQSTPDDSQDSSENAKPKRSKMHDLKGKANLENFLPTGIQDQPSDLNKSYISKSRRHNHGKSDYATGIEDAQTDGFNDRRQQGKTDSCEDPAGHEVVAKHLSCKSHKAFEEHFDKKHGGQSKHEGKENISETQSGSPSHPRKSRRYRRLEKKLDELEAAVPNEASALPAPNTDAATTGHPFLRLSSRGGGLEPNTQNEPDAENLDEPNEETVSIPGCKAYKSIKSQVNIPVGVSRLHLVQLPSLQMKPIYWSPVHDIAAVTRGTWFYKDTMYPVEPAVANQLELGYKEVRAWSQTWNDQLNSAIEVGADGEEKIAHVLWPKDDEFKPASRKKHEHILSTDPYCAAKCFNGEAAAEGVIETEIADSKPTNVKSLTKKYPNAQVIYKDSENAFILPKNLQPSAYHGRKPLQKIKKGTTVGIHVVRGFDWEAWEKLHPSKKSAVATKAEQVTPAAVSSNSGKPSTCPACQAEEKRPKVTDLIFVIHGIGQKLSERVESFNFTHAINAFRRSVNVELGNDGVQRVVRKDLGGIMVLPINWRSNVSFEDGDPVKEEENESSDQRFGLNDITPKTIPAVRSMISDVMLDIPFYMSHHKPKMIQAVICEANRVYKLWCHNNPDFEKEGRVHIIAHSLGSAMALDILSKQPTSIPRSYGLSRKSNSKYLDFRTTNLFLAGSPAGFFLFLEKGSLTPREGQGKPGAEDGDDKEKAVIGNSGTFGCLAVDNIYNIMHYNDPIAYRMNATVDPQYAAGLKDARVPSATTGFFESIFSRKRGVGSGSFDGAGTGQPTKPAGMARAPSQLEMEVHDFTREEIAEKKFYLLNDNGQIDWFLSSGGGPLEFQYLNMLGAHSSYWISPDFIRFIVVEVGRKPGRKYALPGMKVVKAGRKA